MSKATVIKINKYAGFKYNIDKKFEAGIVLTGQEVKAIRSNKFEIRDAFVKIDSSEGYVYNLIFSTISQKSLKHKLLLHRSEIEKIKIILNEKRIHGFILRVIYSERNKIKFEIGFGSAKKIQDKRSSEKRSSEKRLLEKKLKEEYI